MSGAITGLGEEIRDQEVVVARSENHGRLRAFLGAFARRKTCDLVRSDDFVMSSIDIPRSQVHRYVQGWVAPLLGDDFYYGYVYREGTLHFVAMKCTSHEVGKIPVFATTLLAPGCWFYRSRGKFFVITHGDSGVTSVVHYEHPGPDVKDVTAEVLPDKIPSTLKLQWSLGRQNRSLISMLVIAFVISLGVYLGAAQEYEGIAAQVKAQAMNVPSEPSRGNLDLSVLIREMEAKLEGGGVITAFKTDSKQLSVELEFERENDARRFIERNGGVYENGKVILGFNSAGPGQLNSGVQSGEHNEGRRNAEKSGHGETAKVERRQSDEEGETFAE